jgi:glucose/arabinose dehydrogenase
MHARPAGILALCAVALAASAALAAERAKPACDEDDGGLTLPEGFCAFVAADGVVRARRLTVAPNGDVYVAVEGEDGGIAALRDGDGDGRLEHSERFGDRGGGTGIQYQDDWLYFGSDLLILRYRLLGGALVPTLAPEIILTGLLPGLAHATRPFEVDDGNLYLNTASAHECIVRDGAANSPGREQCAQQGEVLRFSADTPNQDAATQGRRYTTGMHDGIVNAMRTEDGKRYSIRHDSDPVPAPAATDAGVDAAQSGVGAGMTGFQAGADADDLLFYTGRMFPERYRGGAFVARGSSNGRAGYRVDFVPFADGRPAGADEVFAESDSAGRMLRTPGDAARVGLALGADGSLYISDSAHGRIWRVLYGD